MPVAFDFRLQPGALSINSDINQMIWPQELEYTLQWSDKRLFESSCAGVIAPRSASQPSMVSISKLASRSDISRAEVQGRRAWYWFPDLDFPGLQVSHHITPREAFPTPSRH